MGTRSQVSIAQGDVFVYRHCTFGGLRKDARKEGTKAGKNAASWYEASDWAAVLQGIEDGDPEILDTFPYCDLSGQWADGPTDASVLEDIGVELDPECEDTGERVTIRDGVSIIGPDSVDDLVNDYRDAFDLAVSAEIERTARFHTSK